MHGVFCALRTDITMAISGIGPFVGGCSSPLSRTDSIHLLRTLWVTLDRHFLQNAVPGMLCAQAVNLRSATSAAIDAMLATSACHQQVSGACLLDGMGMGMCLLHQR